MDGPTLSPRPIAPERDFNKRANSLEKFALPAGLFPGASKRLYDALYVRTRGAHTPARTIRATKRDLTEWTGIKNRKTLDMHLRHLTTCGLLLRSYQLGDVDGYTYEVRLPEEVGLVDRGGQTPLCPPEGTVQIWDRGTDQKLDTDGQGQPTNFSIVSGNAKTSFKTKEENFDDDAHARGLLTRLIEVEKKLTGKVSTSAEKWNDLADILITELKIAAGRTTVSNVPAFLAEHLRRRLWKIDKQQATEIATLEAVEGTQTALSEEERRTCPDCAGTNFWYPEGPERGVARCSHLKLRTSPTEKGID
jgi:hypothetical protein